MPLPPGIETQDAPAQQSGRVTWFWRGLGSTLAVLGFAFLFVPVLPTVPILILSAMAFAHGDPAARAKLLAHPRVGPPLKAWFDHGVVSRKAKVFAILSMAIGVGFGIWISGMSAGMASIVGVVMTSVAVWLALRPERAPTA